MSIHAKVIVSSLYKKLESDDVNISDRVTIRLEDEYFFMLREMSEALKFSIPVILSELIELNLIDLVSALDKKSVHAFSNAFPGDGGILEKLHERGIIEHLDSYV